VTHKVYLDTLKVLTKCYLPTGKVLTKCCLDTVHAITQSFIVQLIIQNNLAVIASVESGYREDI
jgi:hypothetical protein